MTPPLRKAICTLATGPHLELLELSEPPLAAYAARHGYDLHVERAPRAPERPVSWSKVPLLLDLLERYELVVWVDADAIVVDPFRDIADELDDDRRLALVMHRFARRDMANCGVLAVRAGDWTRSLLQQVWERTEYLHHPWWEQAALLRLLGWELEGGDCRIVRPSRAFAHVQLLGNEWNSIALDPAPHPRIVHYAGIEQAQRLEAMRADAVRAAAVAARYPASLVLALPAEEEPAWRAVGVLATLPDDPAHEVVLVHDGSGRHDALLAALAGDVVAVQGGVADGLAAARGRGAVVLDGADGLAADAVTELLAAAAAGRPLRTGTGVAGPWRELVEAAHRGTGIARKGDGGVRMSTVCPPGKSPTSGVARGASLANCLRPATEEKGR